MAQKNIKVNVFSQKSIDEAIKYLKDYSKSLDEKVQIFLDRLTDEGIAVIDATMQSASIVSYDKDGNAVHESFDWSNVKNVTGSNGSYQMVLEVMGENLLFIEFGAGVTYAVPQNPKASELGYGVGTYPGQTHAFDPNGWYYNETGGDGSRSSLHSYGNSPFMPVYKSSLEMRKRIYSIAGEVFR